MNALDLLVGLGIGIGLVGVVIPMLPGSLLVGASVLGWAAINGEASGWVVFAAVAAVLVTGSVVKYLVPGKQLQASGVPTSTLLVGGVLGVIGFFVVPVVGLVLGFVLGVSLVELQRTSHDQAWPATIAALRAVGIGILIELGFALLAAAIWLVGVVAT